MRITFHLDGSGLYFDPWEPLHLDAILAWDLAPKHGLPECTSADDRPDDVPLPLLRCDTGGAWVWRASALFPVGPQGEDLQFLRKRFRQGRAELTTGSPSLAGSIYRERNTPLPLLLCRELVAYASGSRRGVRKCLKRIRYLGKYRGAGVGKILGFEVEQIDEDLSLFRDGRAQRYLPHPQGPRLVRPRPPYWNRHERCACLNVGDPIPGAATEWLGWLDDGQCGRSGTC